MKNKLIAAMLILTFHINGMEEKQLPETSDDFLQFHMEGISEEGNDSPQDRVDEVEEKQLIKTSDNLLQFHMDGFYEEANNPLKNRVDEVEEYYKSQSKMKGNEALQKLNEVVDDYRRKSFFEKLVFRVNNITNDKALSVFIRAVAKIIIELNHRTPFCLDLVEALSVMDAFKSEAQQA